MRKYVAVMLIVFLHFFFLSCVSFQIDSKSFMAENSHFRKTDVFFLEPIVITSYNFMEDEAVRYIMDKKLAFALSSSEKIRMTEDKGKGEYIITPELIIKNYEVRYDDRNYYFLSIKVFSEESIVCYFTYEYNGTSSIFDGKVQNIMIEKFLNDFIKNITE